MAFARMTSKLDTSGARRTLVENCASPNGEVDEADIIGLSILFPPFLARRGGRG